MNDITKTQIESLGILARQGGFFQKAYNEAVKPHIRNYVYKAVYPHYSDRPYYPDLLMEVESYAHSQESGLILAGYVWTECIDDYLLWCAARNAFYADDILSGKCSYDLSIPDDIVDYFLTPLDMRIIHLISCGATDIDQMEEFADNNSFLQMHIENLEKLVRRFKDRDE